MAEDQSRINQEEFSKEVCLFAAEQLRQERMSLAQAGELTEKVSQNLNLVGSEQDALRLTRELARDQEYLTGLVERVYMNAEVTENERLVELVRAFAVAFLPKDPKVAAELTQTANEPNMTIEQLSVQFPEFKQFIYNKDAKHRSN